MFPEPSFTGCSFNTSLYRAIGEAIADDARIFNNNGNAGLTFWSPNVNPFRDPRWGRGQEVAGGEDPFAISMYARQFVRGLQEGEDPRYLKVSSCCKHFVAYDLESWNGTGRDAYNAVVSDADLAEYYTPTFQTCVQDARVSSLMCSYNALNGVPTCASSFLLTEIARGEWGFNGSVTARARARTRGARIVLLTARLLASRSDRRQVHHERLRGVRGRAEGAPLHELERRDVRRAHDERHGHVLLGVPAAEPAARGRVGRRADE